MCEKGSIVCVSVWSFDNLEGWPFQLIAASVSNGA